MVIYSKLKISVFKVQTGNYPGVLKVGTLIEKDNSCRASPSPMKVVRHQTFKFHSTRSSVTSEPSVRGGGAQWAISAGYTIVIRN